MDPLSSEQTEQLYRDLLREARAVSKRTQRRMRHLRERFPDLPADEAGLRLDAPDEGPSHPGRPKH